MTTPATRLICSGCGYQVPEEEPYPFSCPGAAGDDDIDHVLVRHLDPEGLDLNGGAEALFLDDEPNPFRKFRRLLHSYQIARSRGMSDACYLAMVDELDRAVTRVDGRGFRTTPFGPCAELGEELGLGSLWIKDETGNVSGSHKARHLFGVMLWLEMQRRLGGEAQAGEPRLAIASCGNAALAAAVVARGAGYALDVFVPTWAHEAVVEQLEELGSHLTTCPRQEGLPGDPCYHAFRQAVRSGDLAFTCQGPDNGLTIEGGQTLAWEIVAELLQKQGRMDRLFVQVGGGALASACIQGLRDAQLLGVLEHLPRLHPVQSQGAGPLVRAWDRLAQHILTHLETATGVAVGRRSRAEQARLIAEKVPAPVVEEALAYAAGHRSEFMWPWEEEPRSLADGILDDETYDWLAVVRGMLETGGYPVMVSEATLAETHQRVRRTTGIAADPTGTGGLAGCLELQRSGALAAEETVAVLLTGVERSR